MRALEKVIKDAVATDNYRSGMKEVLQSVKGSKLVVISSKSIDSIDRNNLQQQANASNVPLYEFPGNSIQLGKLCNKPFRITAIAINTGSAAEIDAIMSEKGATAK